MNDSSVSTRLPDGAATLILATAALILAMAAIVAILVGGGNGMRSGPAHHDGVRTMQGRTMSGPMMDGWGARPPDPKGE